MLLQPLSPEFAPIRVHSRLDDSAGTRKPSLRIESDERRARKPACCIPRQLPFSRELYIEADDFSETPPPTCPPKSCRAGRRRKFFRLKPGGEVRLKCAYIIKCDQVIKDPAGKITELRCTADLDSKTGGPTSARKAESDETPLWSAAIKGTIHWVSAAHAIDVECRLYDRLFTVPEPDKAQVAETEVGTAGPAVRSDFMAHINPHSLEIVTGKCERSVKEAIPDARYQFERLGYFSLDTEGGKLVFNRTITLKDTWSKIERKQT